MAMASPPPTPAVAAQPTFNHPGGTGLRELIGGSEQDRSLRILQHGHYSDLTVTCQGHTFSAHKSILISKGGDFFERAICAGFAETEKSKIDLPEDDPNIIARILRYIYTADYDACIVFDPLAALSKKSGREGAVDESQYIGSRPAKALLHAHMFAAATKFGNYSLKQSARRAFFRELTDGGRYGPCLHRDLPDVQRLFAEVYESTPPDERELRDICLYWLLTERHSCSHSVDCGHRTTWLLLKSIHDLAVDFATHKFRANFGKCQSCSKSFSWIVGPCACDLWPNRCHKPGCKAAAHASAQCYLCGGKGAKG
ncbi:uncharacterized protein AB675_7479 [Cyphellophora attinorum]|uniref:BTB domain-containing protein n=1 Tax=Cyphellophora attinorum TaxID=1664694 RepID=A0A0N1HU86_9EURO|nr:uncharacterized protein AB675_7479 [Phialophora attinorum]KPI40374.1 hypothetical protein AB675_7479 [Phialophora attinorum]